MGFDADQPAPTAQSGDSAQARERDIVAFAKVWAPYGGGSQADIFVTFGLTVEQYFTRLTILLGSSLAGELTPAQRRTILQVCMWRLANTRHLTSSPSPSDSTGPG